MLRAAKLTKRIRKDKLITQAERKALKARRNIIMFRIRQKRNQSEEDLLLRTIPQIQSQVSGAPDSAGDIGKNFAFASRKTFLRISAVTYWPTSLLKFSLDFQSSLQAPST